MKKEKITRVTLVGFVAALVVTQPAETQPAGNSLAIVHAHVVDVRSGSVTPDATIVVRDGRIVSIGREAAPADLRVVDVRGLHILPGLIDAHTHISTLRAA